MTVYLSKVESFTTLFITTP